MRSLQRVRLGRNGQWPVLMSAPSPGGAAQLLGVCLLGALGACNIFTGADDVAIGEGGAGGGTVVTPTGGAGAPTTTTTSPEGGGAPTGGGPGSGGAGAAGAATPTGGAGGAAAGGSSAGGSPPTECTWPAGPYGIGENDVLASSHSWQGYPAHSGAQGTVSIDELFDCDGSRGIHAVLLTTEQWSCGNCQAEATALEGRMAAWEAAGIRVAILLIVGPTGNPATVADALQWKQNFGLESVAVLADPAWTLVDGSIGTPQNSIVDPRTMEIVTVNQGYSGSYPELEALAQQNGS